MSERATEYQKLSATQILKTLVALWKLIRREASESNVRKYICREGAKDEKHTR
jgi:hypothetical protein